MPKRGTDGFYQVPDGNWEDLNYVLRQLCGKLGGLRRRIDAIPPPTAATETDPSEFVASDIFIQNLVADAGVSSFTDSWLRVDQPFLLGDDWYPCLTSGGGAATVSGTVLASLVNVSVGGASFGAAGSNVSPQAMFIPRLISATKVQTKSQFAQARLVSAANAQITRIGPGVLGNPNRASDQCYMAGYTANTGKVRITRSIPGTLDYGTARTLNVGDMVRIEADPSATGVTLRMYINGSLTDTAVDTTAGFPTQGIMNFCYESTTNSNIVAWKEYSCGILN